MRDWIDVTRVAGRGIAVWPGDTEFVHAANAWGDLTVGSVTMSLHTGTHADAPRHFLPGGATIDQLAPDIFVGLCTVIDARGHDLIGPERLPAALAPRVLFRTDAWPAGAPFPASVPILAPETIAALAKAGVILVGVDVPSVDAIDSKTLDNHHVLASAGIAIVESLDLSRVSPGDYELIALPLRLENADASPIRALLRPIG